MGYSGHERGLYITLAAVGMGAKVVERHVTMDKSLKGNDHEASLEPAELAELVRAIRMVEASFGSNIKQMIPCEKACHDKVSHQAGLKTAWNNIFHQVIVYFSKVYCVMQRVSLLC